MGLTVFSPKCKKLGYIPIAHLLPCTCKLKEKTQLSMFNVQIIEKEKKEERKSVNTHCIIIIQIPTKVQLFKYKD